MIFDHDVTDGAEDEDGANLSTPREWDIFQQVSWSNSTGKFDDELILNRAGTHLKYVQLSPGATMDNETYVADCEKDVDAEQKAAVADAAEAQQEAAIAQNPFLSTALGTQFADSPVCTSLRERLIQVAQIPNLNSIEWQRYYDQVMDVAGRANCLSQ